ncbi:hypothetical protein GKZ68_02770 [Hymenobacter sp. BRD128]|uniref:hypothetical protein n=1 Tax=Hymenobacter sp. BRD128 TaxID=2675878 RepID=UPI001566C225|nr:hypothetical protein [Hymenobacter sp. BRD128]QKG55652.1 hypothetical protein GKZ68_02770 [Hymenobacter sp. BRD128]
MRNPFSQPHTPAQWLLSSVCWTTVCLLSWASVAYYSEKLSAEHQPLKLLLLAVSFAPAYSVVWKKAVVSPVLAVAGFSPINWVVVAWLIMLITTQIIWALLELVMLAFAGGMPDQD